MKDDPTTPYEAFTVYLLGLATTLADQFLKFFVITILTLGQSRPLIDGFLSLTYVQNLGAAFSLQWGHGWIAAIVGIAVVTGIVGYQWSARRREPLVVVGLGLVLGGAAGNLIDRLALGHVRDMFDLQWHGQNVFPIFNIADIGVCVGAALLIMASFRRPVPVPVRSSR
ncbi:MAG: signal peptidase II [Candidatus Sericytochromatia bacterium]|nr:signal peptidase II [Candidatus Tanganyikabacteria bacterium]